MLQMCCPIHGGDNPSAISFYTSGHTRKGYWKCRTHDCQKIFKPSVIGFIRGILSHKECGWQKQGDELYSWRKTVDFLLAFIERDYDSMKVDHDAIEKRAFASQVQHIFNRPIVNHENRISRNSVRKNLEIPATYFVERGYNKDILDRYDVGMCTARNKEMSGRAVVPIYSEDYKYMIGCTGRSIYPQCRACKLFHKEGLRCPEPNRQYFKWVNSMGFKKESVLYNYWFAKPFIQKSHTAIVVESPGNIWRLEEAGIRNAVAVMGASLTDDQKFILDKSGALSIVVIGDNDDGGQALAASITDKCQRTYKLYEIVPSKNDISELSLAEIDSEIKQKLTEWEL